MAVVDTEFACSMGAIMWELSLSGIMMGTVSQHAVWVQSRGNCLSACSMGTIMRELSLSMQYGCNHVGTVSQLKEECALVISVLVPLCSLPDRYLSALLTV